MSRVGLTHARIGLEPRWYIGGYGIIMDHLIRRLVAEHWPSQLAFLNRGADPEDVGALIATLSKTILLDIDIALSVYFDAAEKARVEAEKKVATEAAAQRAREDVLRQEQAAAS